MAKNLRKGTESGRRIKIMDASRARDAKLLPQLLVRLDSDETLDNQRHIVRALGNIGGAKAETKLLELLQTRRGVILGDVVHALGKLKVRRAAAMIRKLAEHESEWVRQNMTYALPRLVGKG